MSIDLGMPENGNAGKAIREAVRRLAGRQEAFTMPCTDEELLMTGQYDAWDFRDRCDEELYWGIITEWEGIEFDGGSIL